MAYDPELCERVSKILKNRKHFESKKMFGGVGFLLHGNMCVGIYKDNLVLRLGTDQADQLLNNDPHAKEFDITGKAMKGWTI